MKTDTLEQCKCRMKGHGLKIGKKVDGKWKQKTKKEMLLELSKIEGRGPRQSKISPQEDYDETLEKEIKRKADNERTKGFNRIWSKEYDHYKKEWVEKVNYTPSRELLLWKNPSEYAETKVNQMVVDYYNNLPLDEIKRKQELRRYGGGSLKSDELRDLLDASYDNKITEVDGFYLDDTISSNTSRVFVNPETQQTVVAHQGTMGLTDWGNNLAYALGGTKLYKKTGRYKEAKRVQDMANKKYGKENVTTIGHSQGGLQAELLGQEGKEVITVNKATRPLSNKKGKKQYDISVKADIVSKLNPFQKKSKKDIKIQKKGYNPVKHHSYDIITKLKEDIGEL